MTNTTFTPDAIQAVGPAEIGHRVECTDCEWEDHDGGAAAAEDHAREHRHVVNCISTMATTYWPSEKAAIAVDSTEGGTPFCYDCVGCGSHEQTDDGKAYFYRDEQGAMRFVCWVCARTDANPNFVRAWVDGKTLPTITGYARSSDQGATIN